MALTEVFADQTANGDHDKTWNGGPGEYRAIGTFDGAKVEILVKDGTDLLPTDQKLLITSPGVKGFRLGAGTITHRIKNVGDNTDITLKWIESTGTGPA